MANIKLTANFNITEFHCHDGTGVPWNLVDNIQELAENLQVLRNFLGLPITIISGYRNPTYNALPSVRGEVNSMHLYGKAADIKVLGKTPKQIHAIIEKLIAEKSMVQGGLGLYNSFVHYDIRGTKARW